VLCGIGGRTIEEAQNNISYNEFIRWVIYRKKRGSLNVGIRIEHDLAIIASMFANRYREKGSMPYKVYDFAPHIDEPELTTNDLLNWK
jgi:hypothetical protein